MVRAVVIAQVAVELGRGYYLGRSEQERLEKGRLQLEKHACKWHKQEDLLRTCPQRQRGEGEMMGRRNMAETGLLIWKPAEHGPGQMWGGQMVPEFFLCTCVGAAAIYRNNKCRRKRQVFAAGETFREWIPNLIEVKLSPQK